MSKAPSKTSDFPFDSIFADLTYILLTLFLLSNFTEVVKSNYLLMAILAFPFTLLAFFAMSILSVPKDEPEHTGWYAKRGSQLWRGSLGMVIWFGYLWMMPIHLVIDSELIITINEDALEVIPIGLMFVWFIVILILYSYSKKLGKNKKIQTDPLIRYSSSFVISLFLFFFTSIVTASLDIVEPIFEPVWLNLFMAMVFVIFLPFRMALLLRPPFNPKELVSFFVVYGFFIAQFFLE
jgi:hypothetical protein